MKRRSALPFLVALQCIILFSTIKGNPAQDDGVDLFAAMRRRKLNKQSTTPVPDCSQPCPGDTAFCTSARDPATCVCGSQICDDSLSTTTTTTTPPPTTTPPHCMTEECPPSDYCVGSRNDQCLCEYDCCYPSCPEGQRIDYSNCPSCTNCTCLPDDGSTTTEFICNIDCLEHPECDWRIDYDACQCSYFNCGSPKTTEFECDIDCLEHPECDWRIDYDVCQCLYDNCASTTSTSRKPKRMKCDLVANG